MSWKMNGIKDVVNVFYNKLKEIMKNLLTYYKKPSIGKMSVNEHDEQLFEVDPLLMRLLNLHEVRERRKGDNDIWTDDVEKEYQVLLKHFSSLRRKFEEELKK